MLEFEIQAARAGHRRIAGVDEAGRGPWAGPVFAAAVLFQEGSAAALLAGPLAGLTDSKRLGLKLREEYYRRLTGDSRISWAVASVSAEDIDRVHILRASLRAMARALAQLPQPPDLALVDGLHQPPGLACAVQCLVRGDSRSLSVAAASILAKVTRDRVLRKMDLRYPGYGFASHKGYGTAAHREALLRLGPCPEHRRSFRPVAEAISSAH